MFGALAAGVRRLRIRWVVWRNGRLASPAFQQWATRFRLTRPVARGDTRRLFDICAGFVYSQVLNACLELSIFEQLTGPPKTVGQIAAASGLSQAAAERLLAAAASLDLLQSLGRDEYTLGRLGAAAVGNPAIRAMVAHHDALYRDLADPVALLADRSAPTALRRYWAYANVNGPPDLSAEATGAYTTLMADSQAMIADQVLAACDLSGARHLLDIGGGAGVFSEHVAGRYPALTLSLLDLPSVAEAAGRRLAISLPERRIACHGGDMFRATWADAAGHDIDAVSFVRILHDHDDAAVAALLAKALATLVPGGRLIVAEPMADTPGARPIGAAYFGMYLWAMGQGTARTPATLCAMIRAAGFVDARLLGTPNPLLARVILAHRATATDGD